MAQVIQSTYTTVRLPVLRRGNWRARLLHPILGSFALLQHKLARQAAVGHRGRQRRGCPSPQGSAGLRLTRMPPHSQEP